MRFSAPPSLWLVLVTWIGWPFVGRFLAHRWIHGELVMRAGPGGQDTEFLVYSPFDRALFWLLLLLVPIATTAVWWYRRTIRRRARDAAADLAPPD